MKLHKLMRATIETASVAKGAPQSATLFSGNAVKVLLQNTMKARDN